MIWDHVLKVELGEYTIYSLTCNLGDDAPCRQFCSAHPDGHDLIQVHYTECVNTQYENGCIIAEWVNDGGIESVEFSHTIELPVEYQWNASRDYPQLRVGQFMGATEEALLVERMNITETERFDAIRESH